VTGAAGFIGCHTVRSLLADGHSVAIVALESNPLARLQDVKAQLQVLHADLRDAEAVRRRVAAFKPEACVHLAWYAEPGQYLHSKENLTALTYSLALIDTLAAVGCQRFVGAGSCAEYQTDRGFLHEYDPSGAATIYAATKLACYEIGRQLAAQQGMRFVWGRVFYPYGPWEDPRRLVSSAILALQRGQTFCATDGRQVRDYIHAADIGRAFAHLVTHAEDGIYNIASGTPITVRQLVESIGKLLNKAEFIAFGGPSSRGWDPPFVCGDNSRLRSLGWDRRFDFIDGLADTIAWWERQGSE
jgi:nucleoside-diphosphate-sugar epimerase